jgi:hypothetical protein
MKTIITVTAEEFERYYFDLLKSGAAITATQAYVMAESEHRKLTGKFKYNSFDSFRVCKNRKIVTNIKKRNNVPPVTSK